VPKLTKNKKTHKKSDSEISFFSYFFNLDSDSIDKGIFKTRYWTLLHEVLSEKTKKINWLHIFIPNEVTPTVKDAVEITQNVDSKSHSNQAHTLLDSALSWKVVLQTLKDYFKIFFLGLRIKKSNILSQSQFCKFELWSILQDDFHQSFFGVTAMSNVLFFNLFESAIIRLPYQEKGFYIMENQAWERGLIYAWNKANHGELIGVPHTTVSYWDLRHFFSEKEYNPASTIPLPDKVALNGEAAYKMYCNSGFPRLKILHVEALRYLYLDKVRSKKAINTLKTLPRILILGDYQVMATNLQMNLLTSAIAHLGKDIEFIVKAHPANPIAVSDWPELKLRVVNDSLDQLIDQYDVAYTSNTTASALDAYLSGKFVITILDPNTFNLSPLRDQEGVEFVSTYMELSESIDNLKNCIPTPDVSIDFFSTSRNLRKWRDLLKV